MKIKRSKECKFEPLDIPGALFLLTLRYGGKP